MTRFKTLMLTTSMMTAAERSKGRFMRAPDGHDGGGAPAPAEAAPAEQAAQETSEQENARVEAELDAEFAPREADSEAEEGNQPTEAAKPPVEEKPVHSVEERIADATRLQREAERDAAEARREIADLRAKAAPAPADDTYDPDAAPDPAKYDYGEADPRFIADVATHASNQAYQRNAQATELRIQMADMEAKWQGELAKPDLVERYPDFDTVVTKAADAGEWDCSPLMAVGIKQSPVGADVAYHLATNKADASRIARLTPIEQALEFGRLEGGFMAAAKSKVTAAAPKPTAAPTPPGNRARGAGGQFSTPADTDDFAAFEKSADAMIKKSR